MRWWWPLIAMGLVACQGKDPNQGTIVGNPGDGMVRMAAGTGVTFSGADALVSDMVFTDCDFVDSVVVRDQELDLIEGELVSLEPGDWCELALLFDEPFFIEGEASNGGSFALELEVISVELTAKAFTLDDREMYVFEFGEPGWIDGSALGINGPDDEVFIDDLHPLHDDLARRHTTRSALFEDKDGNGTVSGRERENNNLTSGEERVAYEPPPDRQSIPNETGCRSGQAWVFGAFFVLPLLTRRRREERTDADVR